MDWLSKILSWFEKDQSAFAELSVRRITLEDHPENIAVFQAASLYEACLKADEAMRQDGIQGAVWIRQDDKPFSDDRLAALSRLREKTDDPLLGTANMKRMNGINVKTLVKNDDHGASHLEFEKLEGVDPAEILEAQRLDDLSDLSRAFGECSLSSRYELLERIDPHYDHYQQFPEMQPEDGKMFLGRRARILVARHQPSVIVYNTRGQNPAYDVGGIILGSGREKLKEAWQPAIGDYIFTCDLTWGQTKALAHSSPEFTTEAEEDCRILDVYDVSEGREMSALSSSLPVTDPV